MEALLKNALEIVLPLIATVVATIAVPALMAWLKRNNVVADEARAKILQSALENAAMAAIARTGNAASINGTLAAPAAKVAVDYVRSSVPDTVQKLGLENGRIIELVAPHIERALRKGGQ
ncbi:hypothetical protein [Antarcticirhabdus aurantiaca]|uniref:Uncharacterized protein n=1 Tax=Antarcticirhabdus aurantiaca TaxID=2606717 RepID=A0ACD4NRJ8_9HYPH|nr:hypothetical protein OXU80_03655 [Jeongeuplla avenae]